VPGFFTVPFRTQAPEEGSQVPVFTSARALWLSSKGTVAPGCSATVLGGLGEDDAEEQPKSVREQSAMSDADPGILRLDLCGNGILELTRSSQSYVPLPSPRISALDEVSDVRV